MAIESSLVGPSGAVLPGPSEADVSAAFGPFANAPLAMVMVDRAGRILGANSKLEELFRYGKGALTVRSISTLLPLESQRDHDLFVSAYFDYPATRQMSQRTDLAGRSATGQLVPVEIGLTTIEVGNAVAAVAWVFDLRARDQQDRQFERMVEGSPNGVLLVDGRGEIVLCNGQACKVFGYPRDELLGRSIDALVPTRVTLKHRVYRSNFHEAPMPRSMGGGRDLFAWRRDGSEFPVEIALTPITTSQGRFTLTTVVDISKRKKAELQLRRTNEELLSFAYSASHDLKAPLVSMCGLADVALDDLEDGRLDDVRARLKDVQSKSLKLANLVEQVLAIARVDYVDAVNSRVVMTEVVGEIRDEFGEICRKSNVAFHADLRSQVELPTEPGRLKLVLRNLIGNAIKYRNPDRPDPHVAVTTSDEPGWVAIEVRDNGLGIPAKDQGEVSQMFRRFHAHAAEGSGLGLAMVKKQVEYLQGRLSFTSNDQGTTFQILLPSSEET